MQSRAALASFALCIGLSQAAPLTSQRPETVLYAQYVNKSKEEQCAKKWMSPGPAGDKDRNPYAKTPIMTDRLVYTMWIRLGEEMNNACGNAEYHWLYDARQPTAEDCQNCPGPSCKCGAVAVHCTPQGPRMEYHFIKKHRYFTYSKSWDWQSNSNEGTVNEINEGEGWSLFPNYNQWIFAYFEEEQKNTGTTVFAGKHCHCGVGPKRESLGVKFATIMMWNEPLGEHEILQLARGKLLDDKNPFSTYVGDHAQDHPQKIWPMAPQWNGAWAGGGEMSIHEAPHNSESFAKGALIDSAPEQQPPCIAYNKAATWNQPQAWNGGGAVAQRGAAERGAQEGDAQASE